MKTTDFSSYTEYPLALKEDAETLSYIDVIKKLLVGHGFATQAVDALSFDVRAYTVTLTKDEKARGIRHRYDGNIPFFEVSVSTDATLVDLDIAQGRFDISTLPVQAQSAFMLVDLATHCFAKLDKLSSQFSHVAANRVHMKGSSFELDTRKGLAVHFIMRGAVDEFFGAAADLLILHLKGMQSKPPMPAARPGNDALVF